MTAEFSAPMNTEYWQELALCRDGTIDPDVFFPEDGDQVGLAVARRACTSCPVNAECGAYALRLESEAEFGVWGGLSEKDRGFTNETEPVIEKPDPLTTCAEVIVALLEDPIILERATLVVPPWPKRVLEAISDGIDNRPGDTPLGVTAALAIKNAKPPIPQRKLKNYIRIIVQAGQPLVDGTFDYMRWYNSTLSPNCSNSALSFLLRVGESIPSEAPLEELQKIALTRLDDFNSAAKKSRTWPRDKAVVIDYYGLKTGRGMTVKEVAAHHSIPIGTCKELMMRVFAQSQRDNPEPEQAND